MRDIIITQPPRGRIRPPAREEMGAERVSRRVGGRIVNIKDDETKALIDAAKRINEPIDVKPVAKETHSETPHHRMAMRQQPTPQVAHSAIETLSVREKVSVTMRALEQARRELEKERHKKQFFKRASLFLLAVVTVLSTGYVGVDTWLTNQQLRAHAQPEVVLETGDEAGSDSSAEDSEVLSTNFAGDVDTTQWSGNYLENYHVAAERPRILNIGSLGIKGRILPVSKAADNTMLAPKNIYDAGWYEGSSLPGKKGAMVINGHASETGAHYGLFGKLYKIHDGATISVETGAGELHTYRVVATEIVPYDQVNMRKLMMPYGDATEALNIITCTGKWIQEKQTLDHRLIVYTIPA